MLKDFRNLVEKGFEIPYFEFFRLSIVLSCSSNVYPDFYGVFFIQHINLDDVKISIGFLLSSYGLDECLHKVQEVFKAKKGLLCKSNKRKTVEFLLGGLYLMYSDVGFHKRSMQDLKLFHLSWFFKNTNDTLNIQRNHHHHHHHHHHHQFHFYTHSSDSSRYTFTCYECDVYVNNMHYHIVSGSDCLVLPIGDIHKIVSFEIDQFQDVINPQIRQIYILRIEEILNTLLNSRYLMPLISKNSNLIKTIKKNRPSEYPVMQSRLFEAGVSYNEKDFYSLAVIESSRFGNQEYLGKKESFLNKIFNDVIRINSFIEAPILIVELHDLKYPSEKPMPHSGYLELNDSRDNTIGVFLFFKNILPKQLNVNYFHKKILQSKYNPVLTSICVLLVRSLLNPKVTSVKVDSCGNSISVDSLYKDCNQQVQLLLNIVVPPSTKAKVPTKKEHKNIMNRKKISVNSIILLPSKNKKKKSKKSFDFNLSFEKVEHSNKYPMDKYLNTFTTSWTTFGTIFCKLSHF
ncbi:hypothetical protein H8356DRAFT_1369842 [Neocallimastix lanati (nom. inval.)]|nr:hypothetical protein H8356DRAFT_1369842 [Neocallimastix sp. JGI-2020a]